MSLHIQTPLLKSHPLSKVLAKPIYLKMECSQPSGSFKDRGVGHLCEHYAQKGSKGFISSSGGNAGISVAYAGSALQVPVTVVIPTTTPSKVSQKLEDENATVIIHGANWNEADAYAQGHAQKAGLDYIPPFDHPLIWEGYISIVDELHSQLPQAPDAIVLSVGGGGMLTGVLLGLEKVNWHATKVITSETTGTASLAKSLKAGEHIKLDRIDSIAVTLGARQVAAQAFRMAQSHDVLANIVEDHEALSALCQFADDHRILVEPSCGAALAIAYGQKSVLKPYKNIVIIVCGGNGVNLSLIEKWHHQLGA